MSKMNKKQSRERGEDGKIRAYFERLFAKFVTNSSLHALASV